MAFGLCPPIWPGATLPVSWNRQTQLITVLGATPNWAAARCRDCPPFKTAATARSRRSIDKGLAIHAGLLPSQHVESEPRRFGNPKSIQTKVIPLESRRLATSAIRRHKTEPRNDQQSSWEKQVWLRAFSHLRTVR